MEKINKRPRPIFPPSDVFEESFINFCKNKELLDIFTEKLFQVSTNNEVTYRMVNHWESIGLIDDTREKEGDWRTFNLCDVVWHQIIIALRSFGFPNEKIARVKASLLISKHNYPKLAYYIALAADNINITLIVFDDGTADIGDYYKVLMGEKRGYLNEHHLRININKLAQKFFDWDITPEHNPSIPINPNEIGVIEAMREENVESIKVRFSKGKPRLLEKTENINTEKRINTIKKEHQFQSITQEQENGKIVSIKRTSRQKL